MGVEYALLDHEHKEYAELGKVFRLGGPSLPSLREASGDWVWEHGAVGSVEARWPTWRHLRDDPDLWDNERQVYGGQLAERARSFWKWAQGRTLQLVGDSDEAYYEAVHEKGYKCTWNIYKEAYLAECR
jgi:hypothetical protein